MTGSDIGWLHSRKLTKTKAKGMLFIKYLPLSIFLNFGGQCLLVRFRKIEREGDGHKSLQERKGCNAQD